MRNAPLHVPTSHLGGCIANVTYVAPTAIKLKNFSRKNNNNFSFSLVGAGAVLHLTGAPSVWFGRITPNGFAKASKRAQASDGALAAAYCKTLQATDYWQNGPTDRCRQVLCCAPWCVPVRLFSLFRCQYSSRWF